MNQNRGNPLNKKKIVASIAVVSALAATGYEVNRLSADPVGEKDCPPVFAEANTSSTSQIQVEIAPLSAGERLQWEQKGGTINDVSCLDRTPVYGIVKITSVEDVKNALQFAHENKLKVSMAGVRHSMGGQAFYKNNLVLNMKGFHKIHLNEAEKTITVQSGATWHDIQNFLHPKYAVKAMQSTDIFSVGGSISVNCHGRYVGKGSLANSLHAMRLVTADGDALELSRDRHPDLFSAVIGGYGGLGVVTEVELGLDSNERIAREAEFVALDDYPAWFREKVLGSSDAILHNADLSPPRFERPLAITWRRSDAPLTRMERLIPEHLDYGREQNLIWAASELPFGDEVRKKTLTRSQLEERPVVRRNLEASLDADSLEPRTRRMSTYLLQEYFVPERHFAIFARQLQRIFAQHETHALNVSIRHSPADRHSLMAWARQDVFSFVVYHKQRNTHGADRATGVWTRKLIDAVLACDGRYYLPYRPHATREQFMQAYPEANAFAGIKARVDPGGRFRNALWDRYLPR